MLIAQQVFGTTLTVRQAAEQFAADFLGGPQTIDPESWQTDPVEGVSTFELINGRRRYEAHALRDGAGWFVMAQGVLETNGKAVAS